MVEYKCDTCNKIYKNKFDFTRHLNRKKPCKLTDSYGSKMTQNFYSVKDKKSSIITQVINNAKINDSFIEKKHECPYCKTIYSKNSNLNRHIRSCKIKEKESNEEKEQIFKNLLKEMKEQKTELNLIRVQNDTILQENLLLKNAIKKINTKKNINNGTINSNSNNINNKTIDNSNTINIQLVAYGKEDYDKLTEKEYKIIINKGFKSVQEMVKSLHFNKNRPENHNIYISNIRDNYVMIYEGNKWELRNRKETIEELYIAKKDILVEKFDEMLNKLPEYAIDKFERFINDEQEDKIKEGILEELKLILYNNKNIPLKTKEKLGLLK